MRTYQLSIPKTSLLLGWLSGPSDGTSWRLSLPWFLDTGLFSYMVHSIHVLALVLRWPRLHQGVLLKAAWIPPQGCVITETDNNLLAITFIYSMVFDFLVLSLTAFKLFVGANNRSRLVTLIFKDGLIYFAIAYVLPISLSSLQVWWFKKRFLANLLATVSSSDYCYLL